MSTASIRCRTTRSSPTSKATAPAAISGAPRSVSSMLRSQKAYGGKRSIAWFEIFAGEKAYRQFQNWLPDDSVNAARDLRVSIKGPLTTPVGGGIRSLNVTLRQVLDLYSCIRPVKYYSGVPSPVKHPEKLDVVIFRENTEDVYSGIEFREGTPEAKKLIDFLNNDMGSKKKVRADSGVGIKPISITGTKRLVRVAIQYAIDNKRKSVTLVHKGNIQKFTEGAFREWGYEVATQEFRDQTVTERESWILGNLEANPNLTVEQNAALIEPGLEFGNDAFRQELYAEIKSVIDKIGKSHGGGKWKQKVMINDRIADSIFQQIIIRPEDYSILATSNLNGDYISDAAAAQVGGLGIAPGANVGDGYAVFEATHGTAPKYADKDVINPGSVMLSGVMLLDFLGWSEAAQPGRIVHGEDHPAEVRHLRFRAPDAGRHQGEDQRVRHANDRQHEVKLATTVRQERHA